MSEAPEDGGNRSIVVTEAAQTSVPKEPAALSAELRTVYQLLSTREDAGADQQLTPIAKSRPALSIELLTAFRLLSGVAPAEPPAKPPATPPPAAPSLAIRGPRPGEQWLYLEASDVDVASAVRSIDGVRRVTREGGGIWKVVTERDLNAEIARSIITKGGALKLLLSTPFFPKLGLVREGEK